jgi:hypothetical protein
LPVGSGHGSHAVIVPPRLDAVSTTTRIVLDPLVLDPLVSGLEGESTRLQAAGPLDAVELPGGVPVWAVTRHTEAGALRTDPRLVKSLACSRSARATSPMPYYPSP